MAKSDTMIDHKTARFPDWLNKEFLENALQTAENDPDLKVVSCVVKRATSTGDNYMSELYRTFLEVETGKIPVNREVSLIVKCSSVLPSLRKLVSDLGIIERERQQYQVILPEMNRLLRTAFPNTHQPLAPKCLFCHIASDDHVVFLLEDLKEQGFKMAERRAGLDLNHCLLVMKTLAKFHAASIAVCQNNPSCFKVFLNRVGSESEEMRRAWMDEYFAGVLRSLADETETWTEIPSNYARRLRKLADNITGMLFKVTERDESELNVLTHGDMWTNNIMFRYADGDGRIESIRFLDFQLPHWTSPAMDLLYFLYTSPNEDLLDQHDVLIAEYHRAFEEALSKLGLGHKTPTIKELYQHVEKRGFYAVFAAVAVLPLVLGNPSSAVNMNEIFKNDVQGGLAKSKLHASELYMRTMRRLLSVFDKKGYF